MTNLSKISKDTIKMPNVPSEDTATWWKILRSGYTGYGLDKEYTVYRRPEKSLSSNKFVCGKAKRSPLFFHKFQLLLQLIRPPDIVRIKECHWSVL